MEFYILDMTFVDGAEIDFDCEREYQREQIG